MMRPSARGGNSALLPSAQQQNQPQPAPQSMGAGGGGSSAAALSSGNPNAQHQAVSFAEVERQNDFLVGRLHEKASVLKQFAIDLGDEIQESNTLLDSMGSTFSNTEGLLGATHRRLRTLNDQSGGNLWCYVVLFVVAVFMFCYFFIWGGR